MKVQVKFMGRFGNQLFQYCFARGYAERIGARLETEAWIGQKIFELDDYPVECWCPTHGEDSIDKQPNTVCWSGYFQQQKCVDYYSKSQIRQWLRLKPGVINCLEYRQPNIAFHIRRGDYKDSGYPVVSLESYWKWARNYSIGLRGISIFSDDIPSGRGLPQEISFMDDFCAMAKSSFLFRANSSFSWWASAWGDCVTYSPVIDGIAGGREVEVPFVLGNHPKLADLGFITELRLK